jgi:hypothetical protein
VLNGRLQVQFDRVEAALPASMLSPLRDLGLGSLDSAQQIQSKVKLCALTGDAEHVLRVLALTGLDTTAKVHVPFVIVIMLSE